MTLYQDSYTIREIETPFTYIESLDDDLFQPDVNIDGNMRQIHKRMMLLLTSALFVGLILMTLRPETQITSADSGAADTQTSTADRSDPVAESSVNAQASSAAVSSEVKLAPVFAPPVKYWESKILEWSAAYGVDPNLAAIIMQVESCGDPGAVSVAGAQGLFQVMPFHFQAGENSLDPDTNARRGLNYFADRLKQTNGDIGRAFAGYNGGHVAAGGSWDTWANETQRYYIWTTGIYQDINSGSQTSPTLDRWLAAGGSGLCQQAAQRLGI